MRECNFFSTDDITSVILLDTLIGRWWFQKKASY